MGSTQATEAIDEMCRPAARGAGLIPSAPTSNLYSSDENRGGRTGVTEGSLQPWGVAEGKDAVFQNKHTAETTMTAATKQAVPTMGQDSCECFTSLYESP